MDALELWRQAALTKGPQASSRPVSPFPDDDARSQGTAVDTEDTLVSEDEHRVTNIQDSVPSPTTKPTSSSWVRWWSRSRRADASRPELRAVNSEPPEVVCLLFYSNISTYCLTLISSGSTESGHE